MRHEGNLARERFERRPRARTRREERAVATSSTETMKPVHHLGVLVLGSSSPCSVAKQAWKPQSACSTLRLARYSTSSRRTASGSRSLLQSKVVSCISSQQGRCGRRRVGDEASRRGLGVEHVAARARRSTLGLARQVESLRRGIDCCSKLVLAASARANIDRHSLVERRSILQGAADPEAGLRSKKTRRCCRSAADAGSLRRRREERSARPRSADAH